MKPEPSLAEFLIGRARGAAPRRLFMDIGLGVLVAAVVFWARPSGWAVLVSAGLCFSLYGVWAIAERQLSVGPSGMPRSTAPAWRVTRALAAALGTAAFVALLLSVLGLGLGTWIS